MVYFDLNCDCFKKITKTQLVNDQALLSNSFYLKPDAI